MITLIHNVRFSGEKTPDGYVIVRDDIISEVGHGIDIATVEADAIIDGDGALLMPGAIDCHVHFREPGMTAKADIGTESRAAAAGGVTSIIDMPNTKPATTTVEAWKEKNKLAAEKSVVNYAFFIGATNDNIAELRKADYSKIPGVKLFMGSSTGNMLVDDEHAIAEIFRDIDAVVAVHAEDQNIIQRNTDEARSRYPQSLPVEMHSVIRSSEACYQSSALAVKLARKYDRRLHICHLTTALELSLLEDKPLSEKLITSEVSPHHLLWCDEDYATKGTRIKMNPAVKSSADRDALRQALRSGLIDMVATDHAPHLLADKAGDALTATSGAPMVQFSLVSMLDLFDDEKLVERVMCYNPSQVYGISGRGRIAPGYYADLTFVRQTEPYVIDDAQVVSKCGWTPMAGALARHKIEKTMVNGKIVYDQGRFIDIPGAPLTFNPKTLQRGQDTL